MDGQGGPAILTEVLCNIVRYSFGPDEDEHLRIFLANLIQVLDELGTLLEVAADFDDLLNVVIGSKLGRANVDLDEVLEEILGKVANLLGPCSRPHESLTVRANLANDLANLRLETHVQHAVGLVHDKVSDTTKVRLARLEHVDKTTRGGNHDLHTTLEITDLGALRSATIDGSVTDARVGAAAQLAWNANGQ